MTRESPNRKTHTIRIRRGLGIFRTGRSPFWHARVYDRLNRRYVVRSTKETSRIEARDAAEEIAADLRAKRDTNKATQRDRSFGYFAHRLITIQKSTAHDARAKRALSDAQKLLYREGDGVAMYFGDHDVGKITSGMVRDYLVFLDSSRKQPLAPSTKSKHTMMIRKVLMCALEDGEIDHLPPIPKFRTKDRPRISFTDTEYKHLLKIARQSADRGDTVRGVRVTREHYNVIVFAVHSFLRPTATELFGIRFCDVEVNRGEHPHLVLTVQGKTGYRKTATLEAAVDIFEEQTEHHVGRSPTDPLFFPEYPNRTTAVNTYRRIFNHFLTEAGLGV